MANAGFVFLVAVVSAGCGGDRTSGAELGPGGTTPPPESQTFEDQIQPGEARLPDPVAPTVTTAGVSTRVVRTAPPVSTAPPPPAPATVAPEPVPETVPTTGTTETTAPATTTTTSPTTTTSGPAVAGGEAPEPDQDPPSTTTTTRDPLRPGDLQKG